MLRKNVAGQILCFAGINATTGAALTGATFSVRRAIDGTFAAGGGTITEDTGLGFYKCALSQADTNGNDLAFFFTATNAIPVCINVLTTAADPSDTVRFGLTALPNAAAEASGGLYTRGTGAGQIAQDANGNIRANIDTIKTQTVTCAAGVTVLASVGTAATSTAQTGDTFARLGAPAGASTAADIAAINAKTTNLPASPASTTNITAGTITTVTNLTNAPTAGDLTATMKTSVENAVWDAATASHSTAGTTGKALTDAGAAGNPWSADTASNTVAGSFGLALGTTLQATEAAIKAKTDNLPAAPAAVSDIPTATQNADALLKRDMSAVSGEAARSPLNALRFLRNKWSMSGTTLTVTKEDDATSAWTATVTTDAAAVPIIGNDPA